MSPRDGWSDPNSGNATGKPNGRHAARVGEYRKRRIPGRDVVAHIADDYLVRGWFDAGEAVLVYGPSGTGKTFAVLDVCLHLASGTAWNGCAIMSEDRLGAIVYVISEGRTGLFMNRVVAWCEEHPTLAEVAMSRFHIIPLRSDFFGTDDADCLAEALFNDLGPIGAIVVDTMSANMGSGDEARPADTTAFHASMATLRAATEAATIVVHHAGKDPARGARGSSNIKAGADVEIELTRSGDIITMRTTKERDRPGAGEFCFRLVSRVLGTTERGHDVTAAVVVPATKEERATARDGEKVGKLTGQKRVALEALRTAAAAHGRRITESPDYPSSRLVVAEQAWRDEFYRCTDGEGEAQRKAFQRARSGLQEMGLVCHYDGNWWLAQASGT